MKACLKTLLDFIKKYYIFILVFSAYILITYLIEIPNCPVKLLTGYPCPGCGMTRAGFSIFKLDFKSAFEYNPLIFVLPFILIILIFAYFLVFYAFFLWLRGGEVRAEVVGGAVRRLPNPIFTFFIFSLF